MKRFHVHIVINDLAKGIEFYSKLFGTAPDKSMPDYAKWMLEDPRMNFAISTRGQTKGLNHFGFQVDSAEELQQLKLQTDAATNGEILDQGAATCCYANSEKHWAIDPAGIAWEQFYTMSDAMEFGNDATTIKENACCIPADPTTQTGNCCG